MRNLRKTFTGLKNNNLFIYYCWTLFTRLRGKYEISTVTDRESINNRYRLLSGRLPNIEEPILFSEKMQWIKLNYYNAYMETCADKFLVTQWIKDQGYGHLLNDIYQVVYDVRDINFDTLPDKFTIKATHGSGWNLIVKDKNKINWFIWKKILRSWLKSDIYWAAREWVYKNLKPALIIEKYLEEPSGELRDYKFHCFNGKPTFVQVNQGRNNKEHTQNFYDLNWNLQDFGKDIPANFDVEILPPFRLNEMIEIAVDLSKTFKYVRVDFYEVDKTIIFGELTFFPAGGYPDFKPKEYDAIWGELLDIENELNADER